MTKRYSYLTPEHKKKAVELVGIDTSLDTPIGCSDDSDRGILYVTTLNKRDFWWWRREESNLRQRPYESPALPLSYAAKSNDFNKLGIYHIP